MSPARNKDGSFTRFAFKHLTEEFLASLTPTELDQAMSSHIDLKNESRKFAGTSEIMASVSPTHRRLYWVMWVEADVFNTGFDLVFSQTDVATLMECREGLRLLKADEHLRLFDEAVQTYAYVFPAAEELRQQLDLPIGPKLEDTDIGHRFLQVEPDLAQRRRAYWDQHRDELVTAPW